MKKSVFYKSDYTIPKKGSHNPFGQLFYDVNGMAEHENLFTVISVKPGLSLSFIEKSFHNYPQIEFEIKNTPVDFSFCLSGSCVHRINGLDPKKNIELTCKAGMNIISCLPNISGNMEFDPKNPISFVGLKIDRELLFTYLEKDTDRLSKKVLDLFDSNKKPHFICPMSQEMILTALQIIHPPSYTEKTRSLFYESRALELLALQMSMVMLN